MRHPLRTLFTLVAAVSATLAGCADRSSGRPLAPVQISKAEPPPGCQLAGGVRGTGWSVDEAYSELRQEAREKRANYVVLDGVAGGVFGRAFRCPGATGASPAAPAAPPTAAASSPAPACEPECSPGYVCVRGACVSACNPPCGAGQRCGADRTCHAGGI